MQNNLKIFAYLIPLAIFILLAILFWRGLGLDPKQLPSTLINKPAPVFKASSLANPKAVLNEKIFLKQVTIFHVFATWCNVCRQEHAFLVKQAKRSALAIIGLDYKDQRELAQGWLQELGNPYQDVIFDGDGKIAIDWGVYGTPETFVIDKQGIIRYKYTGMLTAQLWQTQILPLIQRLQKASLLINDRF